MSCNPGLGYCYYDIIVIIVIIVIIIVITILMLILIIICVGRGPLSVPPPSSKRAKGFNVTIVRRRAGRTIVTFRGFPPPTLSSSAL